MKHTVRTLAIMGLLALSALATAAPTFAIVPPPDGSGEGNCSDGVARIYLVEHVNWTGRLVMACVGADRSDMTVIPWTSDGSCSTDNQFTSENETCSNDQVSSLVILHPNSGHCQGTGWATITLYAHRNAPRFPYVFHVQNNANQNWYENLNFMGATDTDDNWNDEISGFSIYCGYN